MKQTFLLSFSFLFFISCNQQKNTSTTKEGSSDSTSPADSTVETNSGAPTFIITLDTISTRGPQSITRNILQDRNGNIWLATWQGIICYDGKLFTNYTLTENLIHNHIFCIVEDKRGNIWFGTIGGGAYKYDGKTFKLFTTKDGLTSDIITCLLEDNQGNIWFGTDMGVSCYDGRAFKNFDIEDGLSDNSVNAMLQDKTGNIWLGTKGGMSIYNGGSNFLNGKLFSTFKNTNNLSFYNVRSIIQNKKGNILIGHQDGLSSYDPVSSTLTHLATNYGGYVFEDKAGTIWLSGDTPNTPGMTLSTYDGKNFTQVFANNNQVFGVMEDNEGNIWFGTAEGVCRYDVRLKDGIGEGKKFNCFLGKVE